MEVMKWKFFDKVEGYKREVMNTLENQSLTYEQQTYRLAKIAENIMDYPVSKDDLFYEMYNEGKICDLDEGHAPYAPRYILPDYEKLLREAQNF